MTDIPENHLPTVADVDSDATSALCHECTQYDDPECVVVYPDGHQQCEGCAG